MALVDFLNDDLVIMDKVSQSDGFGGFVWVWQEGVHFAGKALRKSSDTILIAQQQGMSEIYTITTLAAVPLDRGDYVKRMRDEIILRVTSDPMDATMLPDDSEVKCLLVTAERTVL